jgi:hypothetical protein
MRNVACINLPCNSPKGSAHALPRLDALAPVRQARAEALFNLVCELYSEGVVNGTSAEVWFGKLLDRLPPISSCEGPNEWTLGRIDAALNDLARAGLVCLLGRGGTLFIVPAIGGNDVHSPGAA